MEAEASEVCPDCGHDIDRHQDACRYSGDCSGEECGCWYLVRKKRCAAGPLPAQPDPVVTQPEECCANSGPDSLRPNVKCRLPMGHVGPHYTEPSLDQGRGLVWTDRRANAPQPAVEGVVALPPRPLIADYTVVRGEQDEQSLVPVMLERDVTPFVDALFAKLHAADSRMQALEAERDEAKHDVKALRTEQELYARALRCTVSADKIYDAILGQVFGKERAEVERDQAIERGQKAEAAVQEARSLLVMAECANGQTEYNGLWEHRRRVFLAAHPQPKQPEGGQDAGK